MASGRRIIVLRLAFAGVWCGDHNLKNAQLAGVQRRRDNAFDRIIAASKPAAANFACRPPTIDAASGAEQGPGAGDRNNLTRRL
jgi:hypothetical protein